MMLSLAAQVAACTGSHAPPRAAGVLVPGSQADRIYQLLDDSSRPWTAQDVMSATDYGYDSVTCALRRLCELGLIERCGAQRTQARPRTMYRSVA